MKKTVLIIFAILVPAAILFFVGYWIITEDLARKRASETSIPTLTPTVTASVLATITNTVSISVTTTSTSVSKEQAVEKVRNLPEVKDYMTRVPQGIVEFDHEDTAENTWVVHVYAMSADASATFNWYNINKTTGETKTTF